MRLRNIPAANTAIENSPYCIKNPEEKKGHWQEVFPKNQPLHIEIGMGKGQFIMHLAKQNPDINYIGIEKYTSVLFRAIQKMETDPLDNIVFLCIDAETIENIFEKGEIEKIYLNFSDPWPKDRHAKRRLTSHRFLDRYAAVTTDHCKIEFKTDNADLFHFSEEEIYNHPQWEMERVTYDLHHDPHLNEGNIMTEYEEKFSSLGNPIYKLIAGKINL